MFHAIKGGCNTSHTKGFQISRPNGLNNYVILIIKSYGEFMIKGKPYTAAPGSAILFAPDTPYSYGYTPVMALDLWEHAYYLDYKSNRDLYINNFFKLVDFEKINKLYEQVTKKEA